MAVWMSAGEVLGSVEIRGLALKALNESEILCQSMDIEIFLYYRMVTVPSKLRAAHTASLNLVTLCIT